MPQEITEAFERAKREVDGRTLRLLETCAMLIKSLTIMRRGFICIDALDEFPAKQQPELWESLRHIFWACPNTRLFVTGRRHIREEAGKYFPGYPDLLLIEPAEEDIQKYITCLLEKDSELDAMDPELKADVLKIIPEKISGSYVTSAESEFKVIC